METFVYSLLTLVTGLFVVLESLLQPGECMGEIRLVGVNASQGRGELQYLYEDQEWARVCSGAVGILDAQTACQYLGFPLLSRVGTVYEPAEANSRGSVTEFFCLFGVQYPQLNEAIATVPTEYCSYDSVLDKPCNNTVYLECHNVSTKDNALLAFIDRLRFWVIAPGEPLLTFCSSSQFYCDSTILVSNDSFFFKSFRPGGNCGTIEQMESFFGVRCIPDEGDVCLLQQPDGCWETGVVTYVVHSRLVGVCAASFGYTEAFVICTELGYQRIDYIYNALLTDYDLPSEVIRLDCSGSERNLNNCSIELLTNNTDCTDVPYLKCSRANLEGTVLIGVDPLSLTSFTIISPAENIYMEDCQAHTPFTSAAVLYLDKLLPSIQHLITQLQNVSSCDQLGPIDLFGLGLPTSTGLLPTSILTHDITKPQTVRTELAAISVIPLVLITTVVSLLLVLVCHRYKQRRDTKNIIEEIKNIHNNRYEYVRTSNGAIRPHRSVDIRRPLNLSKTEQDDLKIPFACLTLDKEIGSGAYGSIYHAVIACEHQTEPIEVAVKVLKKMATKSERRSLQLEIDMLRELDCHRHLVSMLAWCHQGDQLALILEYVRGGNLQDFLRSQRSNAVEEDAFVVAESFCKSVRNHEETGLVGGYLTVTVQLQLARQITLGVEYLASKNIVHRDLAARNVLVGEDGILKLADFGLSRQARGNEGYLMQGVEDKLPVRWMAVESIVDRKFTVKSDVWAFGVVLWEIMTYAAFPFYHLTNREVIASVKAGERMAQPDHCPHEVYQIMIECWNADPLQRPTIRNVREMLDELLDTGEYMCFSDGHSHCDPVPESVAEFLHQSLPQRLNNIAIRHQVVQSVM